MNIFTTYKPKDKRLSKYIQYIYFDFKPENQLYEFSCFPHYNNTLSLHFSHEYKNDLSISFNQNSEGLQLFVPIRKDVMTIKQIGKVYRFVIVFYPLGIHYFKETYNFQYPVIKNVTFFTNDELKCIFNQTLLDKSFEVIEDFLIQKLSSDTNKELLSLQSLIDYMIDKDNDCRIKTILLNYNFSVKELNYLFKKYLGLTPKTFQKIIKFRKVINDKMLNTNQFKLTEIAYKYNFFDQSHLIKYFQLLSNFSPKFFFKKVRKIGNEDTFFMINKSI